MDPLIINAAVTGMLPTKDDNPNVPITPKEIIADAQRCRDAGASIIHLHAREPEGRFHFAGEHLRCHLHTIADPEDRDAQIEDGRITERGAIVEDTCGATGEDYA